MRPCDLSIQGIAPTSELCRLGDQTLPAVNAVLFCVNHLESALTMSDTDRDRFFEVLVLGLDIYETAPEESDVRPLVRERAVGARGHC